MTMAATVQEERPCAVCNEAPGKYKCGKCAIPFCSVPCSQTHKPTCRPPTAPPKPPTPPPQDLPNRRKPPNPFSALDTSPELTALFKRYPNLQSLLLSIDAAMQPPAAHAALASLPPEMAAIAANASNNSHSGGGRGGRGSRGRGRGGRGGGNAGRDQVWTPDLSVTRGKAALNRLCEQPGKDGEAVREYQALVLKLVGDTRPGAQNGGPDGGNGVDVAGLLREQLEEEDARIIEGLLRVEEEMGR